jgi:hypothetical protein
MTDNNIPHAKHRSDKDRTVDFGVLRDCGYDVEHDGDRVTVTPGRVMDRIEEPRFVGNAVENQGFTKVAGSPAELVFQREDD